MAVAAWVVATTAAGCGTVPSADDAGRTVAEAGPDEVPAVVPAPRSAQYVLFAVDGGGTEVERASVEVGRPIGFGRKAGRLSAVADGTSRPLRPGHYQWRVPAGDPEAGRTRWASTALDAVAGVGAVTVRLTVLFVVGYLQSLAAQPSHS